MQKWKKLKRGIRMQKNRIDVIIPAYKAQDTILRTLSSIAMQDIIDDVDVTIVNDADGIGYKKFVDMFSPFMSIREIELPENGGPGDARQFGIDNTSNELLVFIDADDTFADSFTLKTLSKELLAEPENVCCFGNFYEQTRETFVPHQNDIVWMFGKIYKRAFLDKYGIRFKKGSRANEDAGFNMLCNLFSNDNEKIKFVDDLFYFWHFKEDSITRINNAQYSYDQCFVGYAENMIYAIKHAEKINPFNPNLLPLKVKVLCNLYEHYIETIAKDEKFIEQNFKYCKLYYNDVYKEIDEKISLEVLAEVYNNVMRNAYIGNKLAQIIPSIGIIEFLEQLRCKEKDDGNIGQ